MTEEAIRELGILALLVLAVPYVLAPPLAVVWWIAAHIVARVTGWHGPIPPELR